MRDLAQNQVEAGARKTCHFFGHFWDIEIFRKWAHPYFLLHYITFTLTLFVDEHASRHCGGSGSAAGADLILPVEFSKVLHATPLNLQLKINQLNEIEFSTLACVFYQNV